MEEKKLGRKPIYKTAQEKEVAKKLADKARNATRINIKAQFGKWRQIMAENEFGTDEETAKFLIECYERSQHFASTPFHGQKPAQFQTPIPVDVSKIVGSSGGETDWSDFKKLESSQSEGSIHRPSSVPREKTPDNLSTDSDPFGLIAATKNECSFKPQSNEDVSSPDSPNGNLDFTTLEEDVLSFHQDNTESDVSDDIRYSIQTAGSVQVNDANEVIGDRCTIAFKTSLEILACHAPREACGLCKGVYTIKYEMVGTALYMIWECPKSHVGFRWCSQPRLRSRGVHAGDFILCSSILMSGNNFTKVALLCKFMNLGIFTKSFFNRIQSLYCCPVIDQYWLTIKDEVTTKLKGKALILAGDARNDSPGKCAQYCTYTLMEHSTHDIVEMVIIDKREVNLKSPNMEPEGLKRALASVIGNELTVAELVTDAHATIAKIIREEYPLIFHNWDIWHGAKNITKKLNAAAAEKSCKDLAPWVKDFQRHFWYCAEKAGGSTQAFIMRWRGLLHHIINIHVWSLGECEHQELSDERTKEWLVPDGPAHNRLRAVMLDKRFMNTIPHYVNFRHTGLLESFHNHLLMYAAKRFSFRYHTYKARNQLAAIDYQKHKERPVKVNRDGKEVYSRTYSKRSGQWSAVPVKVDKSYDYISDLLHRMIDLCINDTQSMKRKIELPAHDPRRISSSIAPVQPPPTKELVQYKKSRFGAKNKPQISSNISPSASDSS